MRNIPGIVFQAVSQNLQLADSLQLTKILFQSFAASKPIKNVENLKNKMKGMHFRHKNNRYITILVSGLKKMPKTTF